jgi:anti-sigma B factor antagonist
MSDGQTPPPGRLGVRIETDGGEVSLGLEGELDLASVGELERQLELALATNPQRVVLDLRRLSFIDSSGLRAIIHADTHAREQGAQLVLRPGGAAIQRVFELTGALNALHFLAADQD